MLSYLKCLDLYLCCFCKLLGFVSMCFVGFYGLYYAYAAFMFCCLVLLAKCYVFFFKYSHYCAQVGSCSLMHILYVLCIGWVLGMQVICIELIGLYVRIFIPSVNEYCGHYFIVITCMVKPWFITLFHFAWSHCACLICITSFSTYNDHIVLLCLRRFLFIWFKNYTDSRVRCKWVLFNCFHLTC